MSTTQAQYMRAWRAKKRNAPPTVVPRAAPQTGCCDFCHTQLGKVVYTPLKERGKARKHLHKVCFEIVQQRRAA